MLVYKASKNSLIQAGGLRLMGGEGFETSPKVKGFCSLLGGQIRRLEITLSVMSFSLARAVAKSAGVD